LRKFSLSKKRIAPGQITFRSTDTPTIQNTSRPLRRYPAIAPRTAGRLQSLIGSLRPQQSGKQKNQGPNSRHKRYPQIEYICAV
jgi:hypothetical protein